VSRFQYKLAAVCILSAAHVQTSVWIPKRSRVKFSVLGWAMCYTALSVVLHCLLYCTVCCTALSVVLHCLLYCTVCCTALSVVLHCLLYCTARGSTVCYTALQWAVQSVLLHYNGQYSLLYCTARGNTVCLRSIGC